MTVAPRDARGQARLAVDIGGTFTDTVLEVGTRRITNKVLTTSKAPEHGVLQGVEHALADAALGPAEVGFLIHGTTLATNAIIERKGAKTALIATGGFRDVLEIADESRFDQYDIFLEKPRPLVPRQLRLTVPERMDHQGRVLQPLDDEAVRALLPTLEALEVESVAVALLHAYANPAHEQHIAALLQQARPNLAVSLSSEVCPEIREYERTSTTCANAYVQPMMAGYLTRLREALAARGFACPLYLMTSGGGLTTLEQAIRLPIRLVESGPAGGAILASAMASECGEDRVLSFDMGGTTAKICLIENGEPQSARSFEVDRSARFMKGSGLPLRIPVIEMVEIGAGGGSIARVDALRRITVGPDSAGSEPGPACYGRGGTEPTVTDADLALGRIDPDRFAGGHSQLDDAAAATALTRAIGDVLNIDIPTAAYGVAEIVDENMANAARVHAIEGGHDVARHTMIAFGGAAPLHAARIAEKLRVQRIIVPRNAGVGSAIGFLRAPISFELVRSQYMRLKDFDAEAANAVLDAMHAEALAVVRDGAAEAPLTERRVAYMRYVGQGHEIVVPVPARPFEAGDAAALDEAFETEYAHLFGRTIPNADKEVLTWSITLSTEVPRPERLAPARAARQPEPSGRRALFDPGRQDFAEAPTFWRDDLAAGDAVDGPALIVENETTTVVSAAFRAIIHEQGHILLERRQSREPRERA